MAQDKKYISPTLLEYFFNKVKSLFAPKIHEHQLADEGRSGFTKVYPDVGFNTDGTMSQAAVTSALNQINIISVEQIILPITLKADAWTGSVPPYKQTINNLDVYETDTPYMASALKGNEDYDTYKKYSNLYNMIFAFYTNNRSITFSASNKPDSDFNVRIVFDRIVTKNNDFKKAVVTNMGFGIDAPNNGLHYGQIESIETFVPAEKVSGNFIYGSLNIISDDTEYNSTDLFVGKIDNGG